MTPADLVLRVCRARGVSLTTLKSKNRHASVVRARQEAMYLLRTHAALSYPEIGRLLNRDHTTCMYGVEVVEFCVHADDDYRDELAAIVRPMTFARALNEQAVAA